MPRRPLTFRQRDLAAAIRTAKKAGITVARFEVDKDGTIRVISGEPEEKPAADGSNPEEQAILEAIKNARF